MPTKLGDTLAYICANYPSNRVDDLANSRITKIVYLADWVSALKRDGRTISGIDWIFAPHGPFVWDVLEEANRDGRLTATPTNTAFGDRKNVVGLRDRAQALGELQLDSDEQAIIDHIIKVTSGLTYSDFIRTVYGTHPVLVSEKGDRLDLREMARTYATAPEPVAAV